MAERSVVLDTPVVQDEQAQALRQATERAEQAEAELAKLKASTKTSTAAPAETEDPPQEESPEEDGPSPASIELFASKSASNAVGAGSSAGQDASGRAESTGASSKSHEPSKVAGARVHAAVEASPEKQPASPSSAGETPQAAGGDSIAAMRNDSMMAHLLDSLDAGKDIGHYGRLVFAMIARHFLPEQELIGWLTRDPDFSAEQARLMVHQVEGRDYSPPRRERLLEWQSQQEFPILPNPDDPDCGNVYRNLVFPEAIYEHIGHYREEKEQAYS
jgi:hypothetical protein